MRVVVGVDSGGSKTRALAVSHDGEPVGYAETGGGNPTHDEAAAANLAEAIRREVREHEVVSIVAGVAGLDAEKDEARVAAALSEFDVPKSLVNDAAVAHFAAFGDGPGIVSIQGTGSTIRAVLEDGRIVRNGDFLHYARGGAVRVGIHAVQRLLTDQQGEWNDDLRDLILDQWNVGTVEELRRAVPDQMELDADERSRRYGMIARAITVAASKQDDHASMICGKAAGEIVFGIRLLGPMFGAEEVPVALVGSCGRSSSIRGYVGILLGRATEKAYQLVDAEFPPVVGAALMVLREEGVEPGGETSERLAAFVAASNR